MIKKIFIVLKFILCLETGQQCFIKNQKNWNTQICQKEKNITNLP